MFELIATILKIIPISAIIALWLSWIKILEQLMRECPWKNIVSHRLLSLLHPRLAKIALIIAYLGTGLIGTGIAVILLEIVIHL